MKAVLSYFQEVLLLSILHMTAAFLVPAKSEDPKCQPLAQDWETASALRCLQPRPPHPAWDDLCCLHLIHHPSSTGLFTVSCKFILPVWNGWAKSTAASLKRKRTISASHLSPFFLSLPYWGMVEVRASCSLSWATSEFEGVGERSWKEMKEVIEQMENRSLFQSWWVARQSCKAEQKKTKGAISHCITKSTECKISDCRHVQPFWFTR